MNESGLDQKRHQRFRKILRYWPFPVVAISLLYRLTLPDMLLLAVAAAAITFGEIKLRRPLLSYYRLVTVSSGLFMVLVVLIGISGGDLFLSSITWAVLTALLAIWTIYYERTEPLT